ncbi:MAG TPA: AAA family ATPase, partial [Actinoplanes sp.]|nr:AAA family ATPase [Actinoplanes sp.]
MTTIFEVSRGGLHDLEVISELGRGAETVVYLVRRRGREYALKLLTTAGNDPRALMALRREAALLGSVGHPLLPRIFEVGAAEAGPYLVLEYVDGCPLSQTLQEGPLDEARAVRLAIDVVGPLTAAHGAGLVHRDVKPDNIILGPDGTARLIDFGLIFRGGAEHDGVAGTLLYGAPEQAGMLKRAVDGRSDLYALGAVLFECVTGHPPYRSLDAGELIRMHATAPVPDPQAIRPDLSPTFTAVITKLMAKDPDDRYQSGESLLDDLHRLAAHPGAVFPVGTAGPPARTEPLVGRDAEVVQLASRWLKARDGHGGTALVEGVAGVGKSRLVRELTTAIAADGDIVLYGKCLPDDPVPLAPLRAAVERCLRVVDRLPPQERANAVERLRRAAGRGGPLLGALSPLLADLVQAPDLSGMDRHDQFVNAVAAFLIGLADEFQGALLYLDDVQWLDGLTREVLRQVTSRLPGTPLLVIATGRDDPDSTAAVGRFMNDMDATLDTRLRLGPLSREAVADLVAFHLGGLRVAPSVVDELVARIGGNPFTVVEYVRAVIDAGLIVPSWEGWRLDQAGLDRLELSDDVLDLVLQRIDGLGGETRRLLAAGAATGRRFGAALVAAICDVDPRHGQYVLAEAEARRLVTATGPDGYRFLHDRIREALLAGLDELTLRRLHQRIAEVLEATGRGEPSYVYATARHYALGETHRTPRKVYASGLAAGRLALAEHAPAEARQFLLVAVTAAQAARLTPDIGLPIALGQACARTGRFAEGLEHLDRALQAEPDRLRRAEVYGQIAEVHSSAWDPGRAFGAVRLGLAELGKPLPGNHLVLVVTTLWCVLAGLAVGLTGIGSGSARDRTRERLRLQAALLDAGARASSMQMHREMRAILGLRALYAVNRLGPAPEYVHHFAGYGLMADVAQRPALAARMYARADAAAAALGDPVLVGYVAWKRGAGAHLADSEEAETWIRALTEHERWLDLGDYLTGVSAVCIQLFKRGRTHEAYAWYARGTARLAPGAQAEGAPIAAAAALIAAQRGRRDEATAALDSMSRFLAANPDNRMQLINLLAARVIVLVELGELGQAFERGTAEFAALGIRPRHLVPEQRVYYIHQALGRLAQCRTAGREHREAALRAAEQAVAMLGEAANNRVLRAFHAAARADLEVLTGRPLDALRTAVPAELDLMPLDAPLISFELARVRARALRALGEAGQAQAHARYALLLAVDQQWDLRARSIRGEFGISGVGSLHTTGAPPLTTVTDPPSVSRSPGALNGGGGGDDRANPSSNGAALSRRLAALQQVSLAAATVLDPRELARVALDETVRILGAERAYLFLVDPDLDQLVPHLGRDGDGNDIDEL